MPHPDTLSSLNEPIFELDLDGNLVYATPALAEWTGRSFLSTPASAYQFAETLGAKDRARFNQAFKRIVEGRTLRTSITLRINAKGATKHGAIELTLAALLDTTKPGDVKSRSSGNLAHIAASLRDARAEKAAEALANLQSAHLLELVENISDACVVEAADGSVEMVNAAFCELFAINVAPQSWVATPCASLFELASMVVDKNAGPIYSPLAEKPLLMTTLLIGKKLVSHTVLAVMNDDDATGIGGRLHLFKRAGALDNTNGNTDGNTDTNAPEAGSNRVQPQFIERIRADLAATIGAAFSAIHHAEQVELSGRALEHFRRVEASAHAAVTAMAGLLDLADIDTHNIALDTAPFRLRENIANLFNILVPRAEELGTELTLRIEQDVPDSLTGDGARLMMVLRHLIEIGFADMPDSARANLHDKKSIALIVQPEYTENTVIHLSFTVEHTSLKRSAPTAKFASASGTKLALAQQIARALAAHGGEQSMQSDGNGNGNKRDIEIRQRDVRQKPGERGEGGEGSKQEEKISQITSYKFTASFSFMSDTDAAAVQPRPAFVTLTGMQVLLVSADKHERERLAELTRNWRMLPREADDAAMALQLLNRMAEEKMAIPLVITSNQLPLQDGFLLAFRIKHHPRLKDTRMMMLAKNGKAGDAIQCRENGISAYLRDPISPDQLVDAIGAVMGTNDDAEATQTLITRHSLREAKTGTVLLIDANHDQAAIAATFLKRRDFRVVVVDHAVAAAIALANDIFDVIIADADTMSLASSLSVATQLRLNFPDGIDIPILLAMTDYAKVDATEYQGVLTKPYEKSELLEKVASALTEKDTAAKSRRAGD